MLQLYNSFVMSFRCDLGEPNYLKVEYAKAKPVVVVVMLAKVPSHLHPTVSRAYATVEPD